MIPNQTNYSYEHQLKKEVQLLNEQKISQPSYTQLFRATRSMQTEEESIPAVKELDYLFSLLILEVDQAREDIAAAMGKDVQLLITSFTTHLEKQAEQMKKRYDEALERILSAGRTNLANAIAKIHKVDECSNDHQTKIKIIDGNIKQMKKRILSTESMLIKYRMYVEKALILAKKAGIDLEINNFNDPMASIELLDSLQKSLDNKEHQFQVLSERLLSKPVSQTSPKKKKPHASAEETETSLKIAQLNHSLLLTKESTINLHHSFDELNSKQMSVEETLAAMKLEFEKAKEKELQITKETLEDFQTQFENLREQAKESKFNLANEKYLTISKQIFARFKHSHTQCNLEAY
ncbi:hypothetical protein HK103_001734 [Boothiomyces macroporosus]|uniref:Uncharacterized protein n=1 Tax=Boothiomyces macroporosus TaxID=261099 RepID=A0AAD5UKC8_9FUNG|nr:hypothetical protein HK103_001734 [Boothiomyces macroporosus]